MASKTTEHGRGTLECDSCDLKVWNTPAGQGEMETHEDECTGSSDPRERFEVGDRVQYSELAKERLDRDHRTGEVEGFSTEPNDHCVRVRWDGNKTASRYAQSFIKHTGD